MESENSYRGFKGLYQIIDIETHLGDRQDQLGVFHFDSLPELTFKRAFWIWNVSGPLKRGFHALKTSHQVLISLLGCVSVSFVMPSSQPGWVDLVNPMTGLYLAPTCWRELYFQGYGASLLVLATESFSEEDYIRDYDEWRKYCDSLKQPDP